MKAWIVNYKKDPKAYTIVAKIEDHIEFDLDTCTDQSQVSIKRTEEEEEVAMKSMVSSMVPTVCPLLQIIPPPFWCSR